MTGITLVYSGTMRMLTANVGTLDGCVKQSLWTALLELGFRLTYKHRELVLVWFRVRLVEGE